MLRLTIAAALAVAVSGCATLTRGTTQDWTVKTTPSGASVKTTNGFACDATPCTFRVERKAQFTVTISKPGFKTWEGQVTNELAGGGGTALAGNILIGGVIGAGIDAGSGAALDLKPNPLEVTLEPETAPAPAAAPVTTPPTGSATPPTS